MGDAGLLPQEDACPVEPVLILRSVGVEGLGVGDDGLFGVEDLCEGVAGREAGDGLARGAEDGLAFNCVTLVLDRGEGLKWRGLLLLLLIMCVFSVCTWR